jgi:hypothetical protein
MNNDGYGINVPERPCTLARYIQYLRDNNMHTEALYYEHDVVDMLKRVHIPDPLSMFTEQVVATLYGIMDAAEDAVERKRAEQEQSQSSTWEVELCHKP